MSLLLPVLLAVFLVIGAGLVLRAIATAVRPDREVLIDDAEYRALLIEKNRAVESLRDLEFDLQLKKISEEDYRAMKGPAQQRALRAIRAVEERAPRFLVLLALLAGGMGTLLSGEAQAFGNAGSGLPQATISTVNAHVVFQNPEGDQVPVEGAWVHFQAVQPSTPMQKVERLIGEAVKRTDASGGASHTWTLPQGAQVSVEVLHAGKVYRGIPDAKGSVYLIELFAIAPMATEAVLEPRLILGLREGVVWVQGEWLLSNPTLKGLDAGPAGIALPLPSPMVGNVPLEAEWFPPQANKHFSLVNRGPGNAMLRDGRLVYFGVLPPGETFRAQFEFPVDILHDTVVLGLASGFIPLKRVMVALTSPAELSPGLRVVLGDSAPVRSMEELRNGETTTLTWTVAKLDGESPVRILLFRLPYEGGLGRDLAASTIGLGAFLALLGFLRWMYLRRGARVM